MNLLKIKKISKHFGEIMKVLGLDLNNPSLSKTPDRVAKMYVEEIFKGLDINNFPAISTFPDEMNYQGLVQVNDIKIHSVCEHHFVPFIGVAKVAYICKDKMIGLSKINRVVDFYCRKPQVQEKLTQEIFNKLKELLNTEDIAIEITAEHFCVKLRGIKDQNSKTITRKLGGAFFDDDKLRNEFLTKN